ncbi:TPA: AAA family ATPase [Legionella pneumophila]|uniref:TniB family NTP-binding protein n=1 Tax=Legionella pneumophila TaxID=446 RepID=UPI000786AE62|nr:TniB family NTP-binding protein [Legionella pneumophila]HAU0031597.1 AAA family ATPase [Legionella pneumophila]HAU0037737.1 AAA family ATPase [Legionella pneumophila]HAU0040791.1 AAA family ATPase [Legionella pneumophila]HAU0061634.1 AAA family ATPase [Legionella pneumophila]HAU0067718.1 AAA family ATPase [Legionella pneumophila]
MPHLMPWAKEIALLPNCERIQRVRTDRWVGYTKATQAVSKLEMLLSHPKRQRMPNLLLIGPTNNGKSMIIEKFRRTHLAEKSAHYQPEEMPIVIVQMPSDPKIPRFYSMLLYAMNVRLISRSRIADLETKVLQALERLKVKLLIIDETHNLLAGTAIAQREFLNLIRFLGNQLKIPIVCVGTKDAYYAVRSDDQLENRFEPFTLPLWQNDEEFASFLTSITATFPLRKPSALITPDLMHFILDKSEGTIGEIMTLLTKATVLAIELGEEMINKKILAQIDYQSPTERKRIFERAFG